MMHIGISEFLSEFAGMSRAPTRNNSTVLRGAFVFSAKPPDGELLSDAYELEIIIPEDFPKNIPIVKEIYGHLGRKIPRSDDYHVNSDNTFCLGSPVRLLHTINKEPTITGFAKRCLIPYLYAMTRKLTGGGSLVFSELAHGSTGIFDDYRDLFSLVSNKQVIETLEIIGMKKRIANKKPCPCNCGKRLGKCSFRFKVNKNRTLASREWFNNHLEELKKFEPFCCR